MPEKSLTKSLLEIFDDKIASGEAGEAAAEEIAAPIRSGESLRASIPEIVGRNREFTEKVNHCDKMIKMWQKEKKTYEGRSKLLMKAVEAIVRRLNLSGTIKTEGGQLSVRTTSTLEVDEDWILDMYAAQAATLQVQLPPYVKVKLSLDKTALNAFIKKDNTLLLTNPDRIHAKENRSVTLKD